MSKDGRYYICGGKKYLSVFDCMDDQYKLKKTIKLKNMAHHMTAVDYNEYTQKMIVTTLNEKVQMHSIDPEQPRVDILKVKDNPSGHFLLEYDDNRCAVFDAKYSEKNGSKFLVLANNGFHLCDVERQW